jgi:hypothetical protein
MRFTRSVAEAAIALAVAAALLAVSAVAALWYRQQPGDRRWSALDAFVEAAARSIAGKLTAPPPFENVLWDRVRAEVATDLAKNPGAYLLQAIAQPIPLPDDQTRRSAVVAQTCDQLPEWTPRNYSPRIGFSVARSYQTFLGSLEPFAPGLSTAQDRDAVARFVDQVRQLTSDWNATVLEPEAARRIERATSELELVLAKHKESAAKRGYRTTGPAEYLTKVWNTGSNAPGDSGGTIRLKKCIAKSAQQDLEGWWNERRKLNPPIVAPAPGVSFTSIDLSGNLLLQENRTSPIASERLTGNVRIQLRRIKVFSLERPDWFNAEAIRLYGRNGNYRTGAISDPSSDFWGPTGIFNLLPVAIVVVDAPSAFLDLPAADAERLVNWANTASDAGLQLSNVSVSRNGDVIRLETSENTVSVRPLPNRETAHIVAIISLKLPATLGSESR